MNACVKYWKNRSTNKVCRHKDTDESAVYQLTQIMSLAFSLSQAVVFEKPGLEGSCLEIDSDAFSFCESQEDIAADGEHFDSTQLKSMGSLKIIGGLWVFILHSLGWSQVVILTSRVVYSRFCCCRLVNLRLCNAVTICINTALTKNMAALLSFQLGGLQRAWVWGPAVHPGGGGVPGLQRLGGLRAAPVTETNTGCKYHTELTHYESLSD